MCFSSPKIPDPTPPPPDPPPPQDPTPIQPANPVDKSQKAKRSGTGSLRIDLSQSNGGSTGSGLNIPT